jgi:hypothetical protein
MLLLPSLLPLPPEEISSALAWLTTHSCHQVEVPVLAVILADRRHSAMLMHLQLQCRQIDRESNEILILCPELGDDPPGTYNPLWAGTPSCELSMRIKEIQRRVGSGLKPENRWGSFAEAALRLLDLEPACLPAIYLRFWDQSGGEHPSPAIVVPLPCGRPEMVSRLLKQLSWASTDHSDRVSDLRDFLESNDLHGWVISDATQVALDEALGGKRESTEKLRVFSDGCLPGSEHERVRMIVSNSTADMDGLRDGDIRDGFLSRRDLIDAAQQHLAPREPDSSATFMRPDLAAGLKSCCLKNE